MRISIALCTYNGEKFLREQLESIALQSRLPDELIVCDDGSSDATINICRSFADSVAFPVHIHRNERNLGSTRNFDKAIALCTGDIIALADQDDAWEVQKLERFEYTFASNPNAGLVLSDMQIVNDQMQSTGQTMWQKLNLNTYIQQALQAENAFNTLLHKNYVTGAAMAFRASFKDDVSPISPLWVHDRWIALIVAATSSIALVSEPLVKYRQHAANQIGANRRPFLARAIASLQTDWESYQTDLEAHTDLYARLTAKAPQQKLALLNDKIMHMKMRTALPKNRLQRIPVILRHLRHYHNHAPNGVMSALRDVLA